MPEIKEPAIVKAYGNIPKVIKEYVGCLNTGNQSISIAKMESPAKWSEPGQTPDFDEYTIVLKGTLLIKTKDGSFTIRAGSAFHAPKGEWVKYSTPKGAEYIAVCSPAFTPDNVHRDPQ